MIDDMPQVVPRQGSGPETTRGRIPPFRWETAHPYPRTVLLVLSGEFDQSQVPRMRELLDARLRSTLGTVVVDCGRVSFMCVDALELLAHHAHQAEQLGITFAVATGPGPAVRRACIASELGRLAHTVDSAEAFMTTPAAARGRTGG